MDQQQLIRPRKLNDVVVSPVSLGTMRFADKQRTKEELVELFSFLYYELGIDVHHSSYEYSSYKLYCEALTAFKKADVNIRHICKLSAPDFKEEKFSSKTLIEKVHKELKNLQTERIDFLQWLFRSEPIDDEIRFVRFEESSAEIDHTFRKLIDDGAVGAVGTFPYTVPFGKKVSTTLKSNSGWITYFNLLEQENILNLPEDQWMIGLRPLAAGQIFDIFDNLNEDVFSSIIVKQGGRKESILHFSLGYCLMNKKVATNVLSINSMEQAKKLQEFYNNPSIPDSKQIKSALNALQQVH